MAVVLLIFTDGTWPLLTDASVVMCRPW